MSIYRWTGVFVFGAAWVFAWLVIIMALAGDAGVSFGVALVTVGVFFVSTFAITGYLVPWAMDRRYWR